MVSYLRMDRRIKKEPTDNEYFEILSMEYDEENHEFHIEFNRSIQIFKIKLLINKLIKGNFVEEFTFENLEPVSYTHLTLPTKRIV